METFRYSWKNRHYLLLISGGTVLLTKIISSSNELKPDRRKILFVLPEWILWVNWILLCLCIAFSLIVGSCDVLIWHDYSMLVLWLVLVPCTYMLSTSLIALPVTLTAGNRLLRREYLELERSHRLLLKVLQKLPVPRDTTFAAVHVNIAVGQMQRGLSESAETHLLQAAKYVKEKKTSHRPLAVIIYCNLGCALFRQFKIQQAIASYNHAVAIIDSMPKFYDSYRIIAYTGLGAASTRDRDYVQAAEYYSKCLDICRNDRCKAINKRSLAFVGFAANAGLALAHLRLGNKKACDDCYGRMMESVAENANCGDANNAYVLSELASAYLEAGDFADCEKILQLAYDWCARQPVHPESQLVLSAYERLLKQTGRENEVADMRRWLRVTTNAVLAS
jgi:tetratricopeptide (TPR) repeat protein